MFDWLKHVLEWLKTPAPYFLPLLLASGFGLFAPFELMEALGIGFWRTEGKPYVGSIFVLSCAVVGCHTVAICCRKLLDWYREFRAQRAREARLKALTPKEKLLLSGYLKSNSRTRVFLLADLTIRGVVQGLQDALILYPAAPEGFEHQFALNIQPWAWDYLQKHPHLVEIKS